VKVLRILTLVATLFSSSFLFLSLPVKHAEAIVCWIGNYSPNGSGCVSSDSAGYVKEGEELRGAVEQIAVTLAYMSVGLAAIFIAIAALLYTTSEGEPRRMQAAKYAIIAAAIGMFIAMTVFIYVYFIEGILKGTIT
jgi:hypothetical protein